MSVRKATTNSLILVFRKFAIRTTGIDVSAARSRAGIELDVLVGGIKGKVSVVVADLELAVAQGRRNAVSAAKRSGNVSPALHRNVVHAESPVISETNINTIKTDGE